MSRRGNLVQTIVSIPKVIAIIADMVPGPLLGHLLVSTNGNNSPSLYDVDPVAKTRTLIASLSQSGDGIALDPVSNVLYVALNGYGVVGYNLDTDQKVWDSGQFTPEEGSPDGLAIGVGELRGELFVNTNQGTIVEVPLGNPSGYTIIASGGTRGDLATVDPNDGTLLLTQTDRIVRLIPPPGGGFVGGPTATTSGNVVEGNLIGLGFDGTTLVGNGTNGVYLSAGPSGNTIGGTAAGQVNTIAANAQNGVVIVDPGTTNNRTCVPGRTTVAWPRGNSALAGKHA